MAVPASNQGRATTVISPNKRRPPVASAGAADARDLIYVPLTRDLPASVLPDPALVTILDQADTAASVGFALAAVLSTFARERGIRIASAPSFSTTMHAASTNGVEARTTAAPCAAAA